MHRTRAALAVLLLTACTAGLVFAQVSDDPNPPMKNESTRLWFVELKSAPTIEGTAAATIQLEQAQFRNAASQSGVRYSEKKAYQTLWNGLTVRIPDSQQNLLASVSGVKQIYPVLPMAYEPMNPVDIPEMATAVKMTGADLAQTVLGLSGKGIKVGVIDTGIDYRHPDLGGCFGPGCRVVGGVDFVGDNFNADLNTPPVPGNDPMDCAGHGTHVAGIIGANGDPSSNGVRGVAPAVTFYAYRVFGCAGSTTSDVMMDAMEQALQDKVDVVNMSIGAAFQWPEYPTATASDRLVNHGIVVVSSIGNSGSNGLYSAGAPGVGKKVIGVASFDNTHLALNYFIVGSDKYGYTIATGAPNPPTSGTATLIRTGTKTSSSDACSPFAAGSLAGKVALVRRGGCTFYQKAFNVMTAGALGVVLYNSSPGWISPTVVGTPAITIPVVSTDQAGGEALDSVILSAGGSVLLTLTANIGYFVNPAGGLMSSFSSYGLAPDLTLKPDISAPGGNIRSTYPLALGGYAVLSGTSMSSPHVAGTAALYLEKYPKTSASALRGILMNTARPQPWWGSPTLGLLDNVHRQGAGMVNIYDAVLNRVFVTPDKVSLGDSSVLPFEGTIHVNNRTKDHIWYDVTYVDALATGPNTFTPSFFVSNATVVFSDTLIKAPGVGEGWFTYTVTPDPTLPDGSIFGGYIVLTPRDGGQVLRVPIAGYKGLLHNVQAMAPSPYGFPWLAKVSGTSFVKQGDNAVFTLQNGDLPNILLHLDEGVAALKIEVHDAVTGKSWQFADNEKWVGRNSSSTGFFAIPWDGITANGNGTKIFVVPNGTYVIVVSILKPLGKAAASEDWETWTSPQFILARP